MTALEAAQNIEEDDGALEAPAQPPQAPEENGIDSVDCDAVEGEDQGDEETSPLDGTDWEETRQIIGELRTLYATGEDSSKVAECLKIAKEIENCLSSAGSETQSIIKSLASTAQVSESQLDALKGEKATIDESIAALSRCKEDTESRIAVKEAERKKEERSLEDIKRRLDAMGHQEATVKQVRKQDLPMLKHALSLYANVTKISWDYASYDEGKVAGTIVNSATGVVRDFSYDTNEQSSFEIANSIWLSMES